MHSIAPMKSQLTLRGYELSVYLGWPDAERAEPQTVLLDLDIHLPTPPLACTSDALDNTICYAQLTTGLQTALAGKSFRLIEYLAAEIYRFLKPQLPLSASLIVSLTKHPPIPGLRGHVCFSYGDAT